MQDEHPLLGIGSIAQVIGAGARRHPVRATGLFYRLRSPDKHLRRTATIVLSLAAVWSAAAQQEHSYVVSRRQVGSVALGAPAQAVYESVQDREFVDLALEGFLTPALRLTLPGLRQRGGITAELIARGNQLVVYRISIDDPSLRTEKGIGVGSTVDDLRRAYDIRALGYGEAGFFVRVDELAASFLLDGGDRSWRDQSDVPGNLKIVRILLTE